MKKFSTLSALAVLTFGSLTAQAQFTVDGTLSAAEVGTGTGKYQLVGTYTNAHSVADRGLKALYMGTTATTLNVMVVASPEQTGYSHLVLYLDMPNKTGIAAGTQLPGSNNSGSPLQQKPTMDMPTTDYGFRITVSPLTDQPGAMYLSRVDYTVTPTASGYAETNMGSTGKTGAITSDSNDPALATTAFKTPTSGTGSVATNTSTGWEFNIPLSALGGAATGSNINVLVGYVNDDAGKSFYSDLLPQIAGQTAAIGLNPNFTTIAGNQYYTYQVGTGVLATRSAGASLQAAAYPNPVVADSRLVYTVADQTQVVTVEAFNSLGQRAALLLSAPQVPGEHSVALAPLHQLAPGVYLVRVQAGSQVTSQRVVVN